MIFQTPAGVGSGNVQTPQESFKNNTDTQSTSDTATLVLDACEVMMGSLIEPDIIMRFMNDTNNLIIEFSQVQAERIGDALVMPGYIMLSNSGLTGMSISDDNLAVASPDVTRNLIFL